MYLIAAQTVQILGLDLGVFLGLMMFVVFMGLILTGYNVAYCFASVAIGFAFLADLLNVISADTFDPARIAGQLPLNWSTSMRDQTLLAVPLFVLMGAILERSGLAERLLNAFGLLMGSLRGGVAAAVIIVGTLLAAATGVVAATVIVMGLLSLPAMLKLKYDHQLATGAIVASGTLAQLLPPSIVLILLSAELGAPIIGLFAGALLPGLLLAFMYIMYVLIVAWVRRDAAPAMPADQRHLPGSPSPQTAAILSGLLGFMVFLATLLVNIQTALIATFLIIVVSFALITVFGMVIAEVLISIVPVVTLIMGVLLAIFQGVATPSESGSVGVFGALLLACFNYIFDRLLASDGATHVNPSWKLDWTTLKAAATSTANITILVMTLLFASLFFRLLFSELGGTTQVGSWLGDIPGGKWGFVAVAMVAVFLLGINLEFLEITYIVVPIFVPAMAALNFTPQDLIWFAVLMAVNLNMAFISPPVGFSLFYLQSVAPPEVKTASIHKGALPFMGLQLVALGLLAVFPQITHFSYCYFNSDGAPEQFCAPYGTASTIFTATIGSAILLLVVFGLVRGIQAKGQRQLTV